MIVPTGELEGRQDKGFVLNDEMLIVPTGELEGRQDKAMGFVVSTNIVPTGELEGRQDWKTKTDNLAQDCTNWGIGRPARHVGESGH